MSGGRSWCTVSWPGPCEYNNGEPHVCVNGTSGHEEACECLCRDQHVRTEHGIARPHTKASARVRL